MLWLGGQILFFILVARGSLAAATQRLSELITYFLPGVRSTEYMVLY